MKYAWLLTILIWTGGLFYGYHHMKNFKHAPEEIPGSVDEILWRKGRAIHRARCTSCHNVNPDLAGPVGPKLRGVSEELLVERLTNGKGGMPPQLHSLRFTKALREYLK